MLRSYQRNINVLVLEMLTVSVIRPENCLNGDLNSILSTKPKFKPLLWGCEMPSLLQNIRYERRLTLYSWSRAPGSTVLRVDSREGSSSMSHQITSNQHRETSNTWGDLLWLSLCQSVAAVWPTKTEIKINLSLSLSRCVFSLYLSLPPYLTSASIFKPVS